MYEYTYPAKKCKNISFAKTAKILYLKSSTDLISSIT